MLASCSWTHGYAGVNYGAALWVATAAAVVLLGLAILRRRIGPDREGFLRLRRWPSGRGRTTVIGLLAVVVGLVALNQWAYGRTVHDHEAHSLGPIPGGSP